MLSSHGKNVKECWVQLSSEIHIENEYNNSPNCLMNLINKFISL